MMCHILNTLCMIDYATDMSEIVTWHSKEGYYYLKTVNAHDMNILN